MKRRVLLMYITKVSGHRQATVAIKGALNKLDPSVEVKSINGFGYTYPVLEKVVNRAYLGVIKRTPRVWDYLYDNPKIVKKTESLKRFLHKTSHAKLSALFKEFQPDTVICTQAFPCGMVADFKRANNLNILLIGVLTDYAPHSFWLNEGVDYYIVPSEEAKERFITKRISPDKIKLFGIPIQPNFSAPVDKHAIAAAYGLNLEMPTILIMGGGQGLGPIKDVVKSLMKLRMNFQIIVIAGINRKLIRWLKKASRKTDKKIIPLEYIADVHNLMEVATLIVTKPGGMTTSEALAKGLPIVIINPIPGQEMRNTDFLLKNGIGVRIDKTSDIGEEIELLLKSSERLESMQKAAYANGRPHAALDIAKLILQ